jgi:hypothetical protein
MTKITENTREKLASFIQPSKCFTLFRRIFPKNESGIQESVNRKMKDAKTFKKTFWSYYA